MSVESGLVLFLPEDDAAPMWLRIIDGEVTQRGAGADWLHEGKGEGVAPDARVMLVAPAGAVALHWSAFPDLSPPQARAAARLLATENSIGPAEDLHVATGERRAHDGAQSIAVATRAQLAGWLAWAQHHGLDPDVIIPAPLLLPEPEEGFVQAVLGSEIVARGADGGFAVDPDITPHIIGDDPVTEVTQTDVEQAILAAMESPPLNLRQGIFAKRSPLRIDRAMVARLFAIGGFIALCSLIIAIVTILRFNFAADALDMESERVARTVLPEVTSAASADAALDARLGQVGGGGLAFTATTAGLFAAMQGAPNVTLQSLSRSADGTLTARLAAPRADDINVALLAIQQAGFTITAQPSQGQGGQQVADITIRGL